MKTVTRNSLIQDSGWSVYILFIFIGHMTWATWTLLLNLMIISFYPHNNSELLLLLIFSILKMQTLNLRETVFSFLALSLLFNFLDTYHQWNTMSRTDLISDFRLSYHYYMIALVTKLIVLIHFRSFVLILILGLKVSNYAGKLYC